MGSQVRAVGEAFAALLAGKGLAATVGSLMGDEVPPEGKALSTHRTAKGLLACVDALMSLQVRRIVEAFRTKRTRQQLVFVGFRQVLHLRQHGRPAVLFEGSGWNSVMELSCLFYSRLNHMLHTAGG